MALEVVEHGVVVRWAVEHRKLAAGGVALTPRHRGCSHLLLAGTERDPEHQLDVGGERDGLLGTHLRRAGLGPIGEEARGQPDDDRDRVGDQVPVEAGDDRAAYCSSCRAVIRQPLRVRVRVR